MPGLLRETVPNHSALPSAASAAESLYDHLLRGRDQAEMFVILCFLFLRKTPCRSNNLFLLVILEVIGSCSALCVFVDTAIKSPPTRPNASPMPTSVKKSERTLMIDAIYPWTTILLLVSFLILICTHLFLFSLSTRF